jgi:hypothetical protein
MSVDKRRRETVKKHKKQRQKARSVKDKKRLGRKVINRPICFDPLDMYSIGDILRSESIDGCTIITYNEINNPRLIVKKITYPVTSLKSVALAFTEIYIKIQAEISRGGSSSTVVFSKICSGSTYEPIGYVVLDTQGGGGLCEVPPQKYRTGIQIGKNDQGGEDIDKLYLEKDDDNLIIKKLIDGDQSYSGSDDPVDIGKNYKNIYTEIRATNRAGVLGVGPLMVYGKIVTDSQLRPVGYIVMERVRGKYLTREMVRENAAEIRKLLTILYDNKITHGDLHNRNIMRGFTESSENERVWIIDYGFADFLSKPVPEELRDYRIAIIPKKKYTHARYEAYENV